MPRPRRDLSPEQIAGYRAGTLTSTQIAAQLGMSPTGVWQKLRAAGVDTSHNPAYDPEILIPREVLRGYRAGRLSICDVAAAAGCSYGGARAALLRLGLSLRRPGGGGHVAGRRGGAATRHLRTLLRWMRNNGYDMAQLAEILGVRTHAVKYWL